MSDELKKLAREQCPNNAMQWHAVKPEICGICPSMASFAEKMLWEAVEVAANCYKDVDSDAGLEVSKAIRREFGL